MYHVVCLCSGVFVVEYLATQTGGATVNNIFKLRLGASIASLVGRSVCRSVGRSVGLSVGRSSTQN